MSTSYGRKMSLEDKVSIIRHYEKCSAKEKYELKKMNETVKDIIENKEKIMKKYFAMQAKLTAVKNLIKTDSDCMGEKIALLEKVLIEWYQRAVVQLERVPMHLIKSSSRMALDILDIPFYACPMTDSWLHSVRRKAQEGRCEDNNISNLSINDVVVCVLEREGVSREVATKKYGIHVVCPQKDDGGERQTKIRRISDDDDAIESYEVLDVIEGDGLDGNKSVDDSDVNPVKDYVCKNSIKSKNDANESKSAAKGIVITLQMKTECALDDEYQEDDEPFELFDVISEDSADDKLLKQDVETSDNLYESIKVGSGNTRKRDLPNEFRPKSQIAVKQDQPSKPCKLCGTALDISFRKKMQSAMQHLVPLKSLLLKQNNIDALNALSQMECALLQAKPS